MDCVSEHLRVCALHVSFFLCVCFEFFNLVLSSPTPTPRLPTPHPPHNKVRGESSCLSVLPCVWLCPDSSVYYLLNCSAFCNQTWYDGGSSCTSTKETLSWLRNTVRLVDCTWWRVSCQKKKGVAVLTVKVTLRAYIINVWLFLFHSSGAV